MLICPRCKSSLGVSSDYEVLECCHPWPVIAGIPMFRDRPKLVQLIRTGKHHAALLSALAPHFDSKLPGRLGKLDVRRKRHRWKQRAEPLIEGNAHAVDYFQLFFSAERIEAHNYSRYRFTQPKHLVALSIASALPRTRLLDIGCGFGHITRGAGYDRPTVGIDIDFFLLYVAKTIIAPEASYVCCDANQPLPFEDDYFDSVISSNTFHFLRDQPGCWREAKRVSTGPIALISMRNPEIEHNVANFALSLAAYHDLIDLPHRMVSDDAILRRYLDRTGPDLSRDEDGLESKPLITIVAARDPSIFRRHGSFEGWPHAMGATKTNPLYRLENGVYRLRWPSEAYKADNPGFDYLKPSVGMDVADPFVEIDLPERY